MGSFISRTLLANDINGPTVISVAQAATWYSEPISITSEDGIWGMFLTLIYATAANATITVEGGTEGSSSGFWYALDSIVSNKPAHGLVLPASATKGVVTVLPPPGQSLPPYIRIKVTAGAAVLSITKILVSRRNLS